MSLQSLYQKATRAYLLTQHVSASHSCLKAINLLNTSHSPNVSSLRRMIHVLFVNIATSLAEAKDLSTTFRILGLQGSTKEDLMNSIWNKVLEGYAGLPGNVDGSVIAVCLLMSLRLGTARIGQQIAEEWLANTSDEFIAELEQLGPMTESAILSNEDEESAVSAYYEVLELYSVNILTALNDYTSAHEFIQYNSYLSDQQKQTFDQRICQKEHQVEEEEKNRKEEEARKAREAAATVEAEAEKKRQQQQELLRQQQSELSKQQQRSQEVKATMTVQAKKDVANGYPVKGSGSTSRQLTTVERISSEWISHIKQLSLNSRSIAYILFLLMIIGLLRSQRSRLRAGIEIAATKLWETLRMGTKVTYV